MRRRRRILGVSPFPLLYRANMYTDVNQLPAKPKTKTATRAVAAAKSGTSGTVANAITARTAMRGKITTTSGADTGGRGRGSTRVTPRAILVRMRG